MSPSPRSAARPVGLPAFSVAEVAGAPRRVAAPRAEVVVLACSPVDGDAAWHVAPAAIRLAEGLGVDLAHRLDRARATGRAGEIVDLEVEVAHAPVQRLLVAGIGRGTELDLRRAGAALARRTRGVTGVQVDLGVLAGPSGPRQAGGLRAFVEGWGLAAYTFSRRSEPPTPPARTVELAVGRVTPDHVAALDRAVATVEAVHLARDLANTPSSEKSPAWLARAADRAVAGRRVAVRVRDAAALEREGFGGLLAVGGGSARPPCLIELRYTPRGADATTPHVVLVGKGITFDTGGLSLKPSDGMVAMKTDMSGGAAVIAVMSALQRLDVPVRVTGLVAAAENMPSGSAYRPGDVVRHYGGTTVEVFNTDAEGRMVLADALAYANARLAPDAVIDIATLTGAATLGLGRRHAALFATDDRLAESLDAAATRSGERLWRLPLVEDYRTSLDSDVADLAHIGRDRTIQGGAITAALFLREFVGDGVPWAHLDIAGPGRSDADEHEVTKGATGFGSRTLLRWLESPTVRRRRA